jgi:hypothetical protein
VLMEAASSVKSLSGEQKERKAAVYKNLHQKFTALF